MASPFAQLRRAGRAHELSHRRNLGEDTAADGESEALAFRSP